MTTCKNTPATPEPTHGPLDDLLAVEGIIDLLRLAIEKDFASDRFECRMESAAGAASHCLYLVRRARLSVSQELASALTTTNPEFLNMGPLLKFDITIDHEDHYTPVDVAILLYREQEGLIWRIAGPLGDECEALPRPPTVKQAKADARLVYPPHSPFKPRASWL